MGAHFSPGAGNYQRRGAVRASDAEREAAAQALHEHFATGRLNKEELGERLGAAYGATTHAQLDKLFTDLPALTHRSAAPHLCTPTRTQAYHRRRLNLWVGFLPLFAVGGLLGDHRHSLVGDIALTFVACAVISCVMTAVALRRLRSSGFYQALADAGRNWLGHRSRW